MSDHTDLITEAERLVMLSIAEGNPVGEFGVTKEIAFVRGVRWAEEVLTRHEHSGRQLSMTWETVGSNAIAERSEMSDFIPTYEQVRDWYQSYIISGKSESAKHAEFDAWLGNMQRLAAVHAWDEGHRAGRDYQGDGWNSDAHDPWYDNPYRKEDQS